MIVFICVCVRPIFGRIFFYVSDDMAGHDFDSTLKFKIPVSNRISDSPINRRL